MEDNIIGAAFKFYKRKKPQPDFSGVFDFRQFLQSQLAGVKQVELREPDLPHIYGLLPVNEWKAYTLEAYPGFTFITNPFTQNSERYWVKRLIEDYTRPPHRSNLDAFTDADSSIDILVSDDMSCEVEQKLKKLHWITLGIHHNWDTKVYSTEESSPMPDDLCRLTRYIAASLNFPHFSPEAAINFYHPGSSLGAHVDCSEYDFTQPLISVSFGCSAVFLLGGTTRTDAPVAVYVDSGDIVVMSGSTRLAYHAVPRILSPAERQQPTQQLNVSSAHSTDVSCTCSSTAACLQSTTHCVNCGSDSSCDGLNAEIHRTVHSVDWAPFTELLEKLRLNVNVRQVFGENGNDS